MALSREMDVCCGSETDVLGRNTEAYIVRIVLGHLVGAATSPAGATARSWMRA